MENHTKLLSLITDLNLTYSAKFVPFSKSRNRGQKALSLNWIITISRGNTSLQTDYTQGVGWLEGYQHRAAQMLLEADNIRYAVENGKWDKRCDKAGFRVTAPHTWTPVKPPALIDILHGLISDAYAIDCPTYEDWASEVGYDTDSYLGRQVYQKCLTIGLKLRAMLGENSMAQLREAYQDY